MNNWRVTIVNTVEPFDKKEVIIHSETVIEALRQADFENPGYYARGAAYHNGVYDGHQPA